MTVEEKSDLQRQDAREGLGQEDSSSNATQRHGRDTRKPEDAVFHEKETQLAEKDVRLPLQRGENRPAHLHEALRRSAWTPEGVWR